MKIGAVICEFNPFHNGHRYLLDKMREKGCDGIICVMSGSFTQRGEAAIADKFSRAESALKFGADVILELPAPYAVASAQRFARGGARIIAATGVVDKVYFGSECGNIEIISKAAKAVDNPKVIELLKEKMNSGDYYPTALEKSVDEVFGCEISRVLSSPNNILGVEYLRELEKFSISAETIERKAVAHDSSESIDGFASASLIREMILKGEDVSELVPWSVISNPASADFGERAVLYKLRTISVDELREIADVTEGLENRIIAAARKCNSLDELFAEIKTKRYTLARLRRIVTSAMLGITKDLQNTPVSYLRVLGFTDKGKDIVSMIAKNGSLPVITSAARGLESLEGNAKKVLECDIKATDVRTLFEREISESGKDFTTAVIKV